MTQLTDEQVSALTALECDFGRVLDNRWVELKDSLPTPEWLANEVIVRTVANEILDEASMISGVPMKITYKARRQRSGEMLFTVSIHAADEKAAEGL